MTIPTSTPRFASLFRSLSSALLIALGLCWVSGALAQGNSEVAACATAYEQAQVKRNAGQLIQAQEHLSICVRGICPDFVKVDCGQWLSEIKREVPSVIFSAIDSKGAELTAVEVSIDGKVVAKSLNGIAKDLDPGPHDIVFEFEGRTVEKQLIVRQGEKNRVFRADFVTTTDSDGDGVSDEADLCPDTPGSLRSDGCPGRIDSAGAVAVESGGGGSPMGAYVLWGVGALGFATFGVGALLGKNLEEEAMSECIDAENNGICTDERQQDLIDGVERRLLIANIGLGVGATGAIVGTVLFVLSRSSDSDSSAGSGVREKGFRVGAMPLEEGGFVTLSGAF